MEPKIFIGSSRESLEIVRALQVLLKDDAYVVPWFQGGVFIPSSNVLDDLLTVSDNFDFGIFVFSPDDMLKIRNNEMNSIRDNVLFESGLFMSKLGKSRTFFLTPSDRDGLRIPSDLHGVNTIEYNSKRLKENIHVALGPASCCIIEIVNKHKVSITTCGINKILDNKKGLILHKLVSNSLDTIIYPNDYESLNIHVYFCEDRGDKTFLVKQIICSQDNRQKEYQGSNFECDTLKSTLSIAESFRRNDFHYVHLSEGHNNGYLDSEKNKVDKNLRWIFSYPLKKHNGQPYGVICINSTNDEFIKDNMQINYIEKILMQLCEIFSEIYHSKL